MEQSRTDPQSGEHAEGAPDGRHAAPPNGASRQQPDVETPPELPSAETASHDVDGALASGVSDPVDADVTAEPEPESEPERATVPEPESEPDAAPRVAGPPDDDEPLWPPIEEASSSDTPWSRPPSSGGGTGTQPDPIDSPFLPMAAPQSNFPGSGPPSTFPGSAPPGFEPPPAGPPPAGLPSVAPAPPPAPPPGFTPPGGVPARTGFEPPPSWPVGPAAAGAEGEPDQPLDAGPEPQDSFYDAPATGDDVPPQDRGVSIGKAAVPGDGHIGPPPEESRFAPAPDGPPAQQFAAEAPPGQSPLPPPPEQPPAGQPPLGQPAGPAPGQGAFETPLGQLPFPAPPGQVPPGQTQPGYGQPGQLQPGQVPPGQMPPGQGQFQNVAPPGFHDAPPPGFPHGGAHTTEFPVPQHGYPEQGQAPTAEEFAKRRAVKPPEPVARMGVRSVLRKGTLGLVRMPPGRKEQEFINSIDVVRRNFGGLRQVTVVNPKGGAGKTVAVLMIAMTFGQKRGGYVLAWDNNETQGTLGMRAQQDFHHRTVRDMLRDLDHFRGPTGRVGDLSQYVRSQGEAMFDVLASDESATAGEMLTANAFRDIREVVSRFYKLIIVDTGNNVRAQNWQAAIDATDQLVITMSARNDSAETAARMLDHLEQTGRHQLVRRAVSVVSMPPSRKDIDLPAIQRHFSARTRAVLLAPYESLIDSGEPIRYGLLSQATRDAWLKIGSAVAEGL